MLLLIIIEEKGQKRKNTMMYILRRALRTATYATVNKEQVKNKFMKGMKSGQNQNKEKGCSLTATDKINVKQLQKNHDPIGQTEIKMKSLFMHTAESPEALYTAVKKRPNANIANNEDKLPPPPLHSVEEQSRMSKVAPQKKKAPHKFHHTPLKTYIQQQ